MAENMSGKDVTLDIVVTSGTKGLETALSLSQQGIIDAFKTAGNDVAGLATRLGVPISYLSITAAKTVTAYGYDAIKISIAVNSGDPVKVLSEIAGAGMGVASGYVSGLGYAALASYTPLTPAGGVVVGAVGGIVTGAWVSEATNALTVKGVSITLLSKSGESDRWSCAQQNRNFAGRLQGGVFAQPGTDKTITRMA